MCHLKKAPPGAGAIQDNQVKQDNNMPPPASLLGKRSKPGMTSQGPSSNTVILTGPKVNLKDFQSLPFTKNDLNQAIIDLSDKISQRKERMKGYHAGGLA